MAHPLNGDADTLPLHLLALAHMKKIKYIFVWWFSLQFVQLFEQSARTTGGIVNMARTEIPSCWHHEAKG
jgi:hypothetical protein